MIRIAQKVGKTRGLGSRNSSPGPDKLHSWFKEILHL